MTATASSHVLGRALRGGSYLFLQKILTFAINSLVLRRLHLSVTGAVTVHFELALATVFLFRDSFRLAFLRMPSLLEPTASAVSQSSSNGRDIAWKTRQQQLVNGAWLSTLLSWGLAGGITAVVAIRGDTTDAEQQVHEWYTRVLVMYCVAAMIEALAEPMYLLAHSSVLVGWQVTAQGLAFLMRAAVQYVGMFLFGLDGLLCYGLAEMAYATTLVAVFAWFFAGKLRANRNANSAAIYYVTELLPGRIASGNSNSVDQGLMALLGPLGVQSLVKYLLTEGDKWVLSLFTTLEQMGVYGIVFHLGSLVPRIVFFPLEEATKTIVSKLSTSNAEDVAQARRFVIVLLKLMHLVGLVFLAFGVNYAYTLVMLLYGAEKAANGVGVALGAYCVYIPFLGLNGISEAFVHSVGNQEQLMRLNKLMAVFFVIYAGSAMLFMRGLALGTVVNDSWLRHGAHVAIGGFCFVVVLATLFIKERALLREELRQLRGSDSSSKSDAESAAADQKIREELRRIPLLAPWTTYTAHSPDFDEELNQQLASRVQDLIFDRLVRSYTRLKKQADDSDASGMLSPRATRTLLENRLVLEAKRKIDIHELTNDMKAAMTMAMGAEQLPGIVARRERKASIATDIPTLVVEFPKSLHSLSELVDQADACLTAAERDNQVTHFRQRPVSQSAVDDAGQPVSRRDARPDRVRYIMSTRLGALPPTKNILEEYPIPREILDALEKQRHYHVDESSLMASFDTIKAGRTTDWDCFFRRSVPIERKPVSFVLSSLEIADERPVPPPSDIFQQNLLESATNEDIMLTEVRQLYDHTHDSYREFRTSLHRHLDLQYLVDLAFRSSLNSTSYYLEEDIVGSEPSVHIPDHLLRSSNAVVSKWRIAKKGAMGRISSRRGAIALHVKTELSKAQRIELINKICHFTPNEVQLMDHWYSHDSDAQEAKPFDPIPMSPELSARFDAVWKELQLPAKERLDLAVKYSSLENSSRLPDAVLLWEVCAALIREREELLRFTRIALTAPKKTLAMVAEETALLTDLAQTTGHLKEALLLTFLEVGDFVTYAGNFYLAKMEHEATELRQSIIDSLEAKRKATVDEGGTPHSGTSGTEHATGENKAAPSLEHKETWRS
ncbi:hypothetical protein P43SY_010561 [Pythium insidiosum]|uniref:Man(5)GlcNAc(2)-PP-dolichol translocation protein RFT1 n=1 Tax=Pythium insidiosum TaxID=114742 RepID=A0AAD5Q6C9_PYTIN|nr:hypothetical protein P43SY_010561 [Pythium insidiosum]